MASFVVWVNSAVHLHSQGWYVCFPITQWARYSGSKAWEIDVVMKEWTRRWPTASPKFDWYLTLHMLDYIVGISKYWNNLSERISKSLLLYVHIHTHIHIHICIILNYWIHMLNVSEAVHTGHHIDMGNSSGLATFFVLTKITLCCFF